MFKCKVFGRNCPKTLHLPRERCGAPAEIRIATMAKFHKSGSKEPFLWNCAATAARINRKAVYSVDIIIKKAAPWAAFFDEESLPAPAAPPAGMETHSAGVRALAARNILRHVQEGSDLSKAAGEAAPGTARRKTRLLRGSGPIGGSKQGPAVGMPQRCSELAPGTPHYSSHEWRKRHGHPHHRLSL